MKLSLVIFVADSARHSAAIINSAVNISLVFPNPFFRRTSSLKPSLL